MTPKPEDEVGSDFDYYVRCRMGWTEVGFYEEAEDVPERGFYGIPPGQVQLQPIDITDPVAYAKEVAAKLRIQVQHRRELGRTSGPSWFAVRLTVTGLVPQGRLGVWADERHQAILRAAVQT